MMDGEALQRGGDEDGRTRERGAATGRRGCAIVEGEGAGGLLGERVHCVVKSPAACVNIEKMRVTA